MSETKKDKNHPMFGKTGENSPRGMLGKFFSKKHKIRGLAPQSGPGL
jgi:hypothetical protein